MRRMGTIGVTAAIAMTFAASLAQAEDAASGVIGAWLVEEIRGAGVSGSEVPTLTISEDGSVSGSSGCNRFAGAAEIDSESLSFGPLASTRMLCSDELMDLEQNYLNALGAASGWRREEAALILVDETREVLVRLAPESTAALITIPVPGADTVQSQSVTYRCDDQRIVDVEYINAGPVSLAILRMEEEFVIAANVIAASGARYAGDRYVWWSRGVNEALLEDAHRDDDSAPLQCIAE